MVSLLSLKLGVKTMSNPPLTAYVDYPSASGSTAGPLTDIYGVVKISKDPGTNIPGTLTVSGTQTITSGLTVSGGGTINNASGAGLSVSGSAGGILVTGGATLDQIFGGVDNTVQTVATSGTITISKRIERCTDAGAVTAVVLTTGSTDGQTCTITNENTTGTNTITMAASATSHVAGGTACVISGMTTKTFTWIASQSLWYNAL